MSEEIVEASIPQTSLEDAPVDVSDPVVEELPEPKKRGRPQGAKDVVKRTRKPAVKIRIEPMIRELPAAAPTPAPEAPVQNVRLPLTPREQPPAHEPQSPRTLFRRYNESMAQERRQKKQEHAQRYVSDWSRWPV